MDGNCTCRRCRFDLYDSEAKDYFCDNNVSMNYGCSVDFDDYCEDFEEKED